MKTIPCDKKRLIAILNTDDAHPDQDAVSVHLDHCRQCQAELERIAADPWWWTDSREWFAESASTSLESSPSNSATANDGLAMSTMEGRLGKIDFLDPPTQPELLGQLGKYQIESVIGQGGMGIVLKGFDHELNRTVAIKVLAPHLASSGSARQRFAREARAAAAVVHDHVVAIHGIETNNDLPYLVMPFVGGESLQRLVEKQGPLDPTDITRISMQIAAGLFAAHEQGLVHRDIKPANILLENGFGRVLITDFGLARAADDASITRSGLVAGTPHYMSPEQANGEQVDARSDLFSLGSVIFFMATGRAPFRGDGTMAVLNAICHKEPRSARQLNASIPEPLETVMQRLLQKRPDDRFASAAKVRTLLADYLAHQQDPARNQLPTELADQPAVSMPLVFAVFASCLALLGLLSWIGQAPVSDSMQRSASMPAELPDLSTVHFDQEAKNLHASMDAMQRQWREQRDHFRTDDDWAQRHSALRDEMLRIEREWMGRSP